MIDVIDYVQLENAAKAIRMCHDTLDSCDSINGQIGEKDKDLIKRIGVKMKHASTLEHLRFTFGIKNISNIDICNLTDKNLLDSLVHTSEFFRCNKYSVHESINDINNDYIYIISTNMRVIIENQNEFINEIIDMIVPIDYKYLLGDN